MDYYQIEWKTSAKKELKKLSKPLITRIVEEIGNLANNPFPKNSKKILVERISKFHYDDLF